MVKHSPADVAVLADLQQLGRIALWSTLVMLAVITTVVCLLGLFIGFLDGWLTGLVVAISTVAAAMIPWWVLAVKMIDADRGGRI